MNEKKKLTTLQILGRVLLALIVMIFIGGIVNSIIKRNWSSLSSNFSYPGNYWLHLVGPGYRGMGQPDEAQGNHQGTI